MYNYMTAMQMNSRPHNGKDFYYQSSSRWFSPLWNPYACPIRLSRHDTFFTRNLTCTVYITIVRSHANLFTLCRGKNPKISLHIQTSNLKQIKAILITEKQKKIKNHNLDNKMCVIFSLHLAMLNKKNLQFSCQSCGHISRQACN